MNELYKDIINLIKSNQTERALSLLIQEIEGKHEFQHVLHEVILINSRFEDNSKNRRINIISNEEFNLIQSQIKNSLLESIKPLNSSDSKELFAVELLSKEFKKCPKCRSKFDYKLITNRPKLKMLECSKCKYMICFSNSNEQKKWQLSSSLIGASGGIAGFLALLGVSTDFDLEDFLDELF